MDEQDDLISVEDLEYYLEDRILVVIEPHGYIEIFHNNDESYDDHQIELLKKIMTVSNRPSFVLIFILYVEYKLRCFESFLSSFFRR